MKAKELQSDDYLSYKGQIIIKVESITKKKVGYHIKPNECHMHYVRLRECKPIPLTLEILEKNGWKHEFDKTDYMVKYDIGKEGKDCWMMWSIKEHNLDVQRQDEKLDMYNLKVSKVVIPCDYVHELQHALRLCGIEKEIEL